VSEQVRALPGLQNRERTLTTHNRCKPVKDWFYRYAEPKIQPGELVLELGIQNYEVLSDAMVILVHITLADPTSGATIAKVSSLKWPTVGKTAPLFRFDASGFKTTFTDAARPAVLRSAQAITWVLMTAFSSMPAVLTVSTASAAHTIV